MESYDFEMNVDTLHEWLVVKLTSPHLKDCHCS